MKYNAQNGKKNISCIQKIHSNRQLWIGNAIFVRFHEKDTQSNVYNYNTQHASFQSSFKQWKNYI